MRLAWRWVPSRPGSAESDYRLARHVPSVLSVPEGKIDHAGLFAVNREATVKVIRKALANEPDIDWLLKNQESVTHYFHQLGLDGKV